MQNFAKNYLIMEKTFRFIKLHTIPPSRLEIFLINSNVQVTFVFRHISLIVFLGTDKNADSADFSLTFHRSKLNSKFVKKITCKIFQTALMTLIIKFLTFLLQQLDVNNVAIATTPEKYPFLQRPC